MTILLSGGGSGGHITPLLAVAHALKKRRSDVHIVFVGQRGDKLADIPAADNNIDEVYTVRAGKFRRYHGEGLKQLLDGATLLKNIRDFFWFLLGLWQSWRLLRKIKPDVIFIKGGFVGAPVGLSAAAQRIAYVTHDSDAIPGLTNRMIARWAVAHAVALPKEIYPYPKDKTFTVGVPVAGEYKPITSILQQEYRRELRLDNFNQVLLVTGGGLGAKRLNETVAVILPGLLARYPQLAVLHIVGRDHEVAMHRTYDKLIPAELRKHVIVKGFVTDLYRYSGAADVIVTRAGATTMAEFAVQAKACVVVPNPQLTGGHQLKNAEVLAKLEAVTVITEAQLATSDGSRILEQTLEELFDSPDRREALGKHLAVFAHPEASQELAELLLKTVS